MTPEQKAAFIIGQAAMLYAEIASMQAENQQREHQGYAPCYPDFNEKVLEYGKVIGYNAILELFRE